MRFGFMLVVLSLLISAGTSPALGDEKPNFVIFLSDDHGWWDSTEKTPSAPQTPPRKALQMAEVLEGVLGLLSSGFAGYRSVRVQPEGLRYNSPGQRPGARVV